MGAAFAIPCLMLIALPGFAQSERPGISPSVSAGRNETNWAEWEAQARMTDGDYDGAVQAERQAEAERKKADQQELAERAPKRP